MNFATHAYYLTQHVSLISRLLRNRLHTLPDSLQKDSEPRAANAWNDYDPTCPLVDFGAFFDGENLVQEDLVLWYNLGMHHVPHTGDLPNVSSLHSTPNKVGKVGDLISPPFAQVRVVLHSPRECFV